MEEAFLKNHSELHRWFVKLLAIAFFSQWYCKPARCSYWIWRESTLGLSSCNLGSCATCGVTNQVPDECRRKCSSQNKKAPCTCNGAFEAMYLSLEASREIIKFPWKKFGVADGARTHDNRNHNPGLYQLSYSHRRSSYSTSGLALLNQNWEQ